MSSSDKRNPNIINGFRYKCEREYIKKACAAIAKESTGESDHAIVMVTKMAVWESLDRLEQQGAITRAQRDAIDGGYGISTDCWLNQLVAKYYDFPKTSGQNGEAEYVAKDESVTLEKFHHDLIEGYSEALRSAMHIEPDQPHTSGSASRQKSKRQ
jgi:hypothetical protein